MLRQMFMTNPGRLARHIGQDKAIFWNTKRCMGSDPKKIAEIYRLQQRIIGSANTMNTDADFVEGERETGLSDAEMERRFKWMVKTNRFWNLDEGWQWCLPQQCFRRIPEDEIEACRELLDPEWFEIFVETTPKKDWQEFRMYPMHILDYVQQFLHNPVKGLEPFGPKDKARVAHKRFVETGLRIDKLRSAFKRHKVLTEDDLREPDPRDPKKMLPRGKQDDVGIYEG
eukprot:Clim_evm38s2 gene=Clim_evmTU38s2